MYGGSHVVAEDTDRAPISYTDLITRAFVLADVLGRPTGPAENVGILLPGSTLTLQTFLALQIQGRVPAMLSFTAGPETIFATCQAAMISTIWTSRHFVETAELEETVRRLAERLAVRYLEDVRAQVTVWHRARGGGAVVWPASAWVHGRADRMGRPSSCSRRARRARQRASSCRTRTWSRIARRSRRLDISARDVVLNAWPPFHAFGLTTGTILPVLSGRRFSSTRQRCTIERFPRSPTTLARRSCWHEHLPGGVRPLRPPLRLLPGTLRVRGRGTLAGRDAADLGRQVRASHSRRIRGHGDEPRLGHEHAGALPTGKCRPVLAGSRGPSGAGVRDRARRRLWVRGRT